jgi:hypothetical protein
MVNLMSQIFRSGKWIARDRDGRVEEKRRRELANRSKRRREK